MKQASILDEPFELTLPCLEVEQPIGKFYLVVIKPYDLRQITFSDVRRMNGDREFESYLGIQRELNKKRVVELQDYVKTKDACFPTAVIVAVPGRCASYDSVARTLTLRTFTDDNDPANNVPRTEIAKVLDGQHRIEGLADFQGEAFDMNVCVFVDMDIENQAYVFSTVNLAQTKVNKSLVYDLFSYAKARSPQKTCHNIAVALDALEGGPFYRRIKRLGSATSGRFTETVTQATFVESLLPYLTKDKVADRDSYLRGKKPKDIGAQESKELIFRNMFLDERDFDIADVIKHFFSAVAARWPSAWSSGGSGMMLNKTNGFKALMRYLRPAYLYFSQPGGVPSMDEFAKLFAKVELEDGDFVVDRFKPGSSGEMLLYRTLLADTNLG